MQKLIGSPQHGYTKRLIEKVPRIWTVQAEEETQSGPPAPEIVLHVQDVVKTYRVRDRRSLFKMREVQAVRGVSFSVRRGENFGIIGESGCGKSTLSRLLSHLEPLDSGRIEFRGKDMAQMSRSE